MNAVVQWSVPSHPALPDEQERRNGQDDGADRPDPPDRTASDPVRVPPDKRDADRHDDQQAAKLSRVSCDLRGLRAELAASGQRLEASMPSIRFTARGLASDVAVFIAVLAVDLVLSRSAAQRVAAFPAGELSLVA